jgi:hypothetical protein
MAQETSQPGMDQPEPQEFIPTPKTDPFMRPRSPRPTHPNTTQRTRLRARNQINPINKRRILNYFSFPNLADELHSLIESGISLSDSDSDSSDSDYDLPPERIHREGRQLPLTQIKWYKEGEKLAARELAVLPLMPAVTDQEDWYGIMVLKKEESESEVEDEMELDSPSRQLRGELSQMSQSESRGVEVDEEVDEDRQPIVTPTHDEVMLWVTQDPVPISESMFTDGELELKQSLKRKRDAQKKLLQRLNDEPGPGSIYF